MKGLTIWCEVCHGLRSAIFEDLTQDELNPKPWGDILLNFEMPVQEQADVEFLPELQEVSEQELQAMELTIVQAEK